MDQLVGTNENDSNRPSLNFVGYCQTRFDMVIDEFNTYLVSKFETDVMMIRSRNFAQGITSIPGKFAVGYIPPATTTSYTTTTSAGPSPAGPPTQPPSLLRALASFMDPSTRNELLEQAETAGSRLRRSNKRFQSPLGDVNLPSQLRRLQPLLPPESSTSTSSQAGSSGS